MKKATFPEDHKAALLPCQRILFALMLTAGALWLALSAAMAADWPQFQRDPARSGLTSDPAPSSGAAAAWKAFTATAGCSGIDTTPVCAEGKVFVLSIAGKVFAFDAVSGAALWNRDLGTQSPFTFELSTPAYAGGRLFVAQQDGRLWALDAGTGTTIWGPVQLGAVSDQINTPLTYADGRIYVGSAFGNKTYYCLDATNGSLVWARTGTHGKGYYWAGGCVIGDYLVYGDDAGWITSVNRVTGALADEENLAVIESDAGAIRSSASYDAETGRVYFTDQGGHLWAYTFDPFTGDLAHVWHTEIGWSTSTPAVHDGKVYVGYGNYAGAGGLHCVSAADGALLWTFTTPGGGGVQSSPVVSVPNGTVRIYFTANGPSSAVYALDNSGQIRWQYTSDEAGTEAGYILQGVALSEGRLYFGNDGGYLYALREAFADWDVNRDGSVNVLDLVQVGLHFGESGIPGWIPEDVNRDGAINVLDLVAIGAHFVQ